MVNNFYFKNVTIVKKRKKIQYFIWLKRFFFSGLILDIVLIAISKAYFRRRRPIKNTDDALGQMGPDVYSFPSGHASRAVFVVFFFMYLWPISIIFYPPLLAWATSVCLSRILMNRHYILDVVAGCLLGVLEGLLISFFWLEESTAKSLFYIFSDEKLDGGEYHV